MRDVSASDVCAPLSISPTTCFRPLRNLLAARKNHRRSNFRARAKRIDYPTNDTGGTGAEGDLRFAALSQAWRHCHQRADRQIAQRRRLLMSALLDVNVLIVGRRSFAAYARRKMVRRSCSQRLGVEPDHAERLHTHHVPSELSERAAGTSGYGSPCGSERKRIPRILGG